ITDRLFWAGSFLGVVELRKQNIEVVTRVIDESSPEILGFTESNSDKLFLTTPNRIYSFQLEAVPFQFEVVYVARKDEYLSSLAWLSGKLVAGFASGDIALLEPRSSSKEPWSIACRIKNESTTQSPVVSLEEISDFKGEGFVLAAWLDGTIRKIHGCRATPYLSSSDSAKVTEGLMTLGPSKALRGTLAFSFSGPRFFTNDEHPTLVNPFLKAEQELKLSKSWLSVDVDESVVLASVQGELFKLDMSSDSSDIYQENIKELPGAAGLKNIQTMEVDLMDRVWVASNSGVWLAGADDLSLQYRLDPDLPISFDHAVSLSSNSGALLFGGTGGFLVIRNPADFPNLRTGGLAISSMALDGVLRDRQSLVAANTILEISNSFTVTMGQKYPRHHDSTSVEHKLVGYDEDWVSSGSRGIATYRGLPPGDYTFRARGTNATGDISANEIELEIHVTTPFWRTYWAYLLYALFAGYLLHLSKRLNDQRVLRSERLLFAEQQEAAFARLEDDYQEQHEASQRLLMREQDGLQENLAAIQLVLDAERNCPIGPPQDSIAPKLTEVFSELQQEITFTAWSKQISCRQLADVVARLTLGDRRGDVDIVVANHADDTAISSRVAFYLCIPLVEVLCVMNRTLDTSQIPLAVVSTRIEKTDDSSLNDEAPRSGMVVVLDSDFSWISDDEELEDLLFRTAYTLESVGGSMERKASPSNQIQVLIGLQ
ncbi:MAG: triple tyrosine motif-containing protein, partial [Pseudomonadota bacterium]